MKKLAVVLMIAVLPLCAQRHNSDRWHYEDHENAHQTFHLSGSGARLLVDNVNGRIHVTGYNGSDVQVTVDKWIRGWSPETVTEGKRDTRADMSQQGNFVRLYSDGPFRGEHNRGDDYYGYRAYFDYEVQVPHDIELTLKGLNDDIEVRGTNGPFDVHGLNGSITMDDVSGDGSVNTLNGPVKVTFTRNPTHDSDFHTLNGRIDVYFQPPLNADLQFQTLNGGVYSDFDVTTLPVSGTVQGGHFIYRAHHQMAVRAGSGGPRLSFNTLNGEILLHSK